jgi:hypothetical protein
VDRTEEKVSQESHYGRAMAQLVTQSLASQRGDLGSRPSQSMWGVVHKVGQTDFITISVHQGSITIFHLGEERISGPLGATVQRRRLISST